MEDIAIALTIVLLPTLAAMTHAAAASETTSARLFETLLKIAAFVALMLVVGARVFPCLIGHLGHTKSRELMSLCKIALALDVAYAA